ncbi:prepilin peptidase [Novispirillum sp. DQ9]|uniref:prepilin peptidase n=1 Tax=Novispirillum sp. DQ9 TaxID=3398612 RepID=UPI003C7CD52D
MDDASINPILIIAAFVVPLLLAAAWDAATYRIPNLLTGMMALAFVPAALLAPGEVSWLWHLGAAAGVLAAGALAFEHRLMGGGDVKLAAACALWLGPVTPAFLMMMALGGGLLALALLLGRRLLPGVLMLLPNATGTSVPRLLTPGQAVPYGLAIAGSGVLLADSLPFLVP